MVLKNFSSQILLFLFIATFFGFNANAFDDPTFSVDLDGYTIVPNETSCPFNGYGAFWLKVLATSSESFLFYSDPNFNCINYPSNQTFDISSYWLVPQVGYYYQMGGDSGQASDVVFFDGVSLVASSSENEKTRILSLDPSVGSTTPSGNKVFFRARAFIASDPSFWDVIKIKLYHQDDNTVISNIDIFGLVSTDLFNGSATTTGLFDFSTSTDLQDGNYTAVFELTNSTLGGTLYNPFGGDTQSLRHQFVVGTSTFLGDRNQKYIQEVNDIFSSLSPTSTSALLSRCNPLNFDTTLCLSGLFLPDSEMMNTIMTDFKTSIMQKAPQGWAVRLFAIITGSATSTPPVLSFSVPDDPYFPASLRAKGITFDPWHVVDEGSILETATGFGTGNLMDTFMPYFKIIIYGLVVFGVSHKILGMSKGYLKHSSYDNLKRI